MNILALDLATRTGWAHSNGFSGVQNFNPRRGDSPGMRWIEFGGWLIRLLAASPADVIVYEQAHHRGGAATHVAHGFISCVETVVAMSKIEITQRHTSAIKAHAIPQKGANRGKVAMLAAARERWPDVEIIDDNQADVLWLLDLFQTQMGEQ